MGRPKGTPNKHHVDKIKVVCPTCGKGFEKYPSWIRRNVMKGCLTYCSRECSDKNRKNVWRVFGKDTVNFKDGRSSYRELAIRERGLICEKCGYDATKYPGLIWVHHKDFSKRGNYNNDSKNLMVLCIRCHMEEHYAFQENRSQQVC